MFIGHFAVAFAGKRAAPSVSLGTLVAAAQFLDLLWPVLVLAGIEHVRIAPGATAMTPLDFYHYPISHSLATPVVWAAGFALVYWWPRRRAKPALVLAAVVLSHWVLDFLVHRPDLPLAPGLNIQVGLGLWNSVAATLAVEFGMFLVGLLLYLRTTRARDRIGSIGLWAFVLFLLALYLGNVFGPPPPGASIVAVSGLGIWLLVVWAWWIDRHRDVRGAALDGR